MGKDARGTLTIFLDKITNLKDGDWLGKSDPYVTFVLEQDNWMFDQKKGECTSSKKSGELNPVYGESFEIPGLSSIQNLILHVKVYDDDIGFDDKMGAVDIKVANFISPGQEPVLIA